MLSARAYLNFVNEKENIMAHINATEAEKNVIIKWMDRSMARSYVDGLEDELLIPLREAIADNDKARIARALTHMRECVSIFERGLL